MKFDEFQTQDRRLSILIALESAAQYTANAYLLRAYLDSVGHAVSADTLATDMAWLVEQGLARTDIGGPVAVATLTARGLDVATGRATVPGVKRREPSGG